MRHSVWKLFKDGQHYAKIWPHHSVVAAMTESRVVPAVNFTARWMPALAMVNFMVQWQWLLPISQIIVTSLFLLSLPLQGWYWLGARANAELPVSLLHWYHELATKLKVQPQAKPIYFDLARLLRKALKELPPEEH
jgi:uncharacterized protein